MIEGARVPCDRARVLDWNDLRYFLAIAKAGTLAGAARELGVEHTTVGRRLTALENALGTKLFVRSSSGFTATDAATAILPLIEEVAAKVDDVARRVAGGDDRVEGVVRLTTSEALSGYFVKRLGALRVKHPNLVVEILSGNRAYDIMRGEADVAVRIRETKEPDLVSRKVAIAGWSMYAAKAYVERKGAPASPEDLRDHDVVAFDPTMSQVPGALWLEAHAQGANVALRANSIVAALNAALVGIGITVLPCFLCDPEPTLARLTPRLLGVRDVSVVVHPDLAKVARVRAVIDFIVEQFARDSAMWRGASEPAS